MEKITSFTIDHLRLLPGVYVSRKDHAGDAVVTTCIGKLAGMLNVSVFKGDEPLSLTEIEDEIAHAGEGDGGEMPVGYSDFTAHGEPTEIGESGNPDKYADLDIPR